jgi:hypothetical protein
LNRLENDAVKQPSPLVLHMSGYPLPREPDHNASHTIGSALFAGLTDDERDELLEYLAWYRARRRSSRGRR